MNGNHDHNQSLLAQQQQWPYRAQAASEVAAADPPLVELKRKLQARAAFVAGRIAETEALEAELPKLLAAIKALDPGTETP